MKAKRWFLTWLSLILILLTLLAAWMRAVDPYFHFHAPLQEHFHYALYNQRSQNDGIARHLPFDAIVTGTSMTENFRPSEIDRLFGTNTAKLPYSGASYKEINQGLEQAFAHHDSIHLIIRCLDRTRFLDAPDAMRTDLGTFPTYLYDSNPFNDGPYLWNRDLFFSRLLPMTLHLGEENQTPGIDSWDSYSYWQNSYTFGRHAVLPNRPSTEANSKEQALSEEQKQHIRENIEQNVLALARAHRKTRFLLFFPPYSAVWWLEQRNQGHLEQTLQAESYILSLLLSEPNIELYTFDTRTDLTTDLNHYKDATHYASWINNLILHWMQRGVSRLTPETADAHIDTLRKFYQNFNLQSLLDQNDWKEDWIAAAQVHAEAINRPAQVLYDAKKEPLRTTEMKKSTAEELSVQVQDTDKPVQTWTIADPQQRLYFVHRGHVLKSNSEKPALWITDAKGSVLGQFFPSKDDDTSEPHLLYLPENLQADQLPVQVHWDSSLYVLEHLKFS